MTEETEKPQERPDKPPVNPRPKMTLAEQSAYLTDLLGRCKLHSPDMRGTFAGTASLMLTTDDMLRLETIQQTIAVFELHRADEMVRDKIRRNFRR